MVIPSSGNCGLGKQPSCICMQQFATEQHNHGFSNCWCSCCKWRNVKRCATHRAIVEGSFIPLFVKTLGIWTPFTKRSLKSVALRLSFKNGFSPKLTFQHLLQQLSVQLWVHNARMILYRFSTLPSASGRLFCHLDTPWLTVPYFLHVLPFVSYSLPACLTYYYVPM